MKGTKANIAEIKDNGKRELSRKIGAGYAAKVRQSDRMGFNNFSYPASAFSKRSFFLSLMQSARGTWYPSIITPRVFRGAFPPVPCRKRFHFLTFCIVSPALHGNSGIVPSHKRRMHRRSLSGGQIGHFHTLATLHSVLQGSRCATAKACGNKISRNRKPQESEVA